MQVNSGTEATLFVVAWKSLSGKDGITVYVDEMNCVPLP